MAAKLSLIEKAKAYRRVYQKCWYDNLKPSERAEIDKAIAAYKAGKMDITLFGLAKAVQNTYKTGVTYDSIRRILAEKARL
jgi:hypothetical protein